MSAAAVILSSEELSIRCMAQMRDLERAASTWEWFSTQPKRVAIAAWFMKGKTIHQMYLQCDQQRDEARSQRATMARTIACLRRAVSYWESANSLPRLQAALTRNLDLLDPLLQPSSLDELYESLLLNHAIIPPSPTPYDMCMSPCNTYQGGGAAITQFQGGGPASRPPVPTVLSTSLSSGSGQGLAAMAAHVAAATGDPKAASVLAPPLANAHLNGSPWHGTGAMEPEKFVRQTPNGMNGAASSSASTRLFVHPALGQQLLNQPMLRTQLDRMRTLEVRLPKP
jgi:hypothetical protein